MSFFPPDPDQPEYEEPDRDPRWTPPDDEIPAAAGRGRVIARTDTAAIVFTGANVYSDGVEVRIDRHLRRGESSAADWSAATTTFMEHGPGAPGGRLRYGLILPDGTRLVADPVWGRRDAETGTWTLARTGGSGGGGGRSYVSHDGLWLHPLPLTGMLELVVQWPSFGIDETRTPIDLGDLGARASEVIPIWA